MFSQDKRGKILYATLKLITEQGFHATPVSDIAREADVGAGTIYRYFASKDAIINELYNIIVEDLTNAMLENIDDNLSIKEKFYLHWKNLLYYFINNEYEGKFVSQYINSTYIPKKTVDMNDARYDYHRILLAKGIEQEIIRKIDFNIVALFMWSTVKQLHYLHINNAITITEELLDDVFNVFWEGIKYRKENNMKQSAQPCD